MMEKMEPLGDMAHVAAHSAALDLRKAILAHQFPGQQELIEEARDALTDILQWMDKNDG